MIFADFSKKIATVCRKCIPFLFLIHILHSVIQILLGKAHTFGCKIFCLHGKGFLYVIQIFRVYNNLHKLFFIDNSNENGSYRLLPSYIGTSQTRMKSRFSSSRVYCIYNDFTTNENPWMKRHGTAGTLAVPFCYHDME